jgi:hypothetical protein
MMSPTRNPPWRDHLNIGFEAIEGELEPDLVVSFPRTAVRHEAEGVVVELGTVEKIYSTTYSQPSLSATAIIPRAMTGRANEVPRRYTFWQVTTDQITITSPTFSGNGRLTS